MMKNLKKKAQLSSIIFQEPLFRDSYIVDLKLPMNKQISFFIKYNWVFDKKMIR